jgi:hypothetical protein
MNRLELPTTSGRRRRVPRRGVLAAVTGLVAIAIALLMVGGAGAVSGAVSTTDNPGHLDSYDTYVNQACLNGQGVNCNIYLDKRDVWMSGLPVAASLGAGTYFFAVLSPGGQPNANDCADLLSNGHDANLSDTTPCITNNTGAGDTWQNRTFSVDGSGTITYSGTHDFDSANNKIQLFPYDNTPNEGGVYILAVCQVPSSPTGTPGVDAHDCKYDAFKVVEEGCTTDCGPPPAADLFGSKNANPAYTREFHWTIQKSVDACAVVNNVGGCNITGSTKTLNYTVTVTKGTGTDSGWNVSGDISVTNPAAGDASNVTVTDVTDVGGTCVVNTDINHGLNGLNPAGDTLLAGDTADYPYTCTFASNPGSGTNTATVSWTPTLSDGSVTPDSSFPATATFTFGNPTTVIHDSVNITDLYTFNPSASCDLSGIPGTPINGSHTYMYACTVTVPHGCVTLDNTATFTVTDTDSDTDDTGSSSVRAKVCRVPANTGALTMGFWQNKNGQGIISGGASLSGVCKSGTWLRQYAPFQDLSATATCAQVATYVYNVIKVATCGTTTCNAMLKAQMLSTALDVYFSDPALGTNKINAPAPIGGVTIDLTQICKMIDGSGGTATCSGTYENVSSAFGGATSLTVLQMLAYAASQSNAGGSVWYGQVKATQVLAKDAFDAINNGVAFSI